MRATLGRFSFLSLSAVALVLLFLPLHSRAEEDEGEEVEGPPSVVATAGVIAEATPIKADAQAVINVRDLERQQAAAPPPAEGRIKTWMPVERQHPAEPYAPPSIESLKSFSPAPPLAPSPSPTSSFMGLNDIPMVDSSYIVIPPDVDGAVGPDKIMEGLNNNYRIRHKDTGVTITTIGTATFWSPVVAANERLSLTDPRLEYDPYNNCWIAVMQTVTSGAGKILVGVSQTSDPQGAWYLYSFNTGDTVDFPILGFNKNWISVSINDYGRLGLSFRYGINLMIDYPQARAGTGTGTLLTMQNGTHFCTAPAVTYSNTEETLYLVTHLSSSGATYVVDTITGTPGSPVYTTGSQQVRTGGGWGQGGGNQLPQAAPWSGSSACGSTPCPMENQDAQVRSAPVFRDGYLYYAQTIMLPANSPTHAAAQWTKINASTGAYVDGGRIEDPTATGSNGGKWYAYPHIAVNAAGDFLVGFSQFSSAQYNSAGYAVHLAGDAAGTLRDVVIYHAGEDYYHKTFSTATGRNRWGDFSTCQVDPSDDTTLWSLEEYAKFRTGTDDGNTGSNSSRWSTWWAGVNPVVTHTITASAGTGGTIDPSGEVLVPDGSDTTFTVTPDPCYGIADVLVDGGSVGPLTSIPFTNVTGDHTIAASFTPLGADSIFATAGAGGTIAPADTVVAPCGSDTTFTITPDPGFSIVDVTVDGGSVGTPSSFPFTNITQNHTIHASFADVTDPTCLVVAPNGGDSLTVGATTLLEWNAADGDSVVCVDLLLSRTGAAGAFDDTLALCIPDTSRFEWTVTGPATDQAVLRMVAHDRSGNTCTDDSDATFKIAASQTAVSEELGPIEFALTALSANPAHGSPHLRLSVPTARHVKVAVFDVSGREVAVLADREFAEGRYELTWNTDGPSGHVPSGLYFIRAVGLDRSTVLRMIVTR